MLELFQIFAAFGTHQITAKGVKAPANMRSYLQTLLGMYSHDSLLISSFSGPFWLAILKQQNDFITVTCNGASLSYLPQHNRPSF